MFTVQFSVRSRGFYRTMNKTVNFEAARAQARAVLPFPWEVGPMAGIFSEQPFAFAWLEPPRISIPVEAAPALVTPP